MRLALLGTDADLLALAAAARVDGHEIAWLGDVRPSESSAVRNLANPRVVPSNDWETLIDQGAADAVLVGKGEANEDQRGERLKRLVAAAVPLLVVHPALLSVLTYYELDMTSREVGGVLHHYNPAMAHPMLESLSAAVRFQQEEIGQILQIACARDVPDGSRENVLAGLARDAELLAYLAGDIHRVSAVGPRSEGASFASLQVQMEAAGPASVRWSAAPKGRGADRVVVSLIGEKGTIEWSQSTVASNSGAVVEYALQSPDESPTSIEFDAATHAIREFVTAAENHTATAWQNSASTHSTWPAATRAMEVVDAVELGLQKGRTIEVHQQKLTEQLAFRGTMAALGCGLMLLVMLAALIVGVLGGVESLLQQPLIQGWAAVLLIILGFFLLLQVIPYLGKRRRQQPNNDSGP